MLSIGEVYTDNAGREVTIGNGLVKPNNLWVWSIQGDWYDSVTGRFVSLINAKRVLLPATAPKSISDHTPKNSP